MSHEKTETVYDEKTHSWVNKRTVHKKDPMNPEQKRFFAKKFKTEKEASAAT